MSWGAGTVIMNRYQLESMLGQGGMGSVWKAEHLQLKSPVAIKMLDPAIADNEQMLARFLREAQACAALRSPHVVQIFDYGVDDGTAFIAMEMLHGESLSDRIARLGRLPPDEAIRFISEVLRAIGKAHDAGIVHRDLKPDNVFICRDEPEFAKVLDFGVAKITNKDLSSSGGKTQTGMMIGTPYYMSPEQTQAKDVDHRADLWGIAIIAYECVTGQRPFTGESFGELVLAICTSPMPLPSKLAPVPAGFDEWFVRGTQRDKTRRFQTAREMAEELNKLLGGASLGPRPALTSGAAALPAAMPGTHRVNSPAPIAPGVPAVTARVDEMQLTTGQRAVVSGSPPSSARSSTSPVVYALGGLAALIVVGVVVFVGAGGAAAFREPSVEENTAAALAAPETAPPPVDPPPASEPVAAAPSPLPAPAPSAAPSASAAAPPASAPPASKPAPQPASTAAKSAKPKQATAPKRDPLPPRNWEF
jgi:eukaryotic-like serine/threonine-protein kinase